MVDIPQRRFSGFERRENARYNVVLDPNQEDKLGHYYKAADIIAGAKILEQSGASHTLQLELGRLKRDNPDAQNPRKLFWSPSLRITHQWGIQSYTVVYGIDTDTKLVTTGLGWNYQNPGARGAHLGIDVLVHLGTGDILVRSVEGIEVIPEYEVQDPLRNSTSRAIRDAIQNPFKYSA